LIARHDMASVTPANWALASVPLYIYTYCICICICLRYRWPQLTSI